MFEAYDEDVIIAYMAVRDLKSFFPTAEELLNLDLRALGQKLLLHLHSWKDQGRIWQPVGGLNRLYFFQWIEGTARGLGPAPSEPTYGSKQSQVSRRLQEAWNWLEREGLLMHNPNQPLADWYVITSEGDELVTRLARYEHWEKLGLAQVKADLEHAGGLRVVGGGPGVTQMAWEWVQMKEQHLNEVGDQHRPLGEQKKLARKVFVVHGHDGAAREKIARFLERLEFEPIILHEQASRGRTVIEKVEAHSDVGFAVVLLTPDDEGCKKGGTLQPRARQNVVLELGYFLGRLGRTHVCALKRGELEIPSDFEGVVYVSFDDSDGWKQDLGRELEAAGFTIDWNKAMGLGAQQN